MKPIQQQLSTALGDKEPSAETQLVKQVCVFRCSHVIWMIYAYCVMLDGKDDPRKNLV